jgi:hypothetical protein
MIATVTNVRAPLWQWKWRTGITSFSLPESPGLDFGEDSMSAAVVHVTYHIQMFLVFTSHRFDVRNGEHQNLYAVRGVYFPVELRPYSGSWPSLTGLGDHSIWTHHTWWDSSERLNGPSQRPLPDNTQHSQETDIHAPGGIRTCNPSQRAAADPRLTSRRHWHLHQYEYYYY